MERFVKNKTMAERIARVIDRMAWQIMDENKADGPIHARIEQSKLLAHAAIEEMRSPTPKMLRAACAAMSPGKRPTRKRVSEKAKHGIRYRAMIDAAAE